MSQRLAEALQRSRSDEPLAFAAVYDEYSERILAHVARRVLDAETALDLTAESFARAYLKRRTFRGATDAEVSAWLFRIADREVLKYFRRAARGRRAVRRLGMELPSPDEQEQARIVELAGLEDLRAAVRDEIQQLSESQRTALQLRIVEELPYEEVAGRLGISQEAARTRVARGLKSLARSLEHYRPDRRRELRESPTGP